MIKPFLFLDTYWKIEIFQYTKGNAGIMLVRRNYDSSDIGVMYLDMIATMDMHEGLEYDELAIKNFAEYKYLVDALVEQEIVEEPHRYVEYPFAYTFKGINHIPIVRLKSNYANPIGTKLTEPKQNSHDMANSAKPAAK
jgi:hypothetical protein